MSLFSFVILCLATWRISSLLVQEDGPFFIFRKIRELSGIKHDSDGDIFEVPETFFSGILSCVWCCSVWTAFFVWIFWLIFRDILIMIALWPAISAGTIILDSKINKA